MMRSARLVTVRTVAAIASVAGLEHGVGEILQGNVAPAGLMFESWPKNAFFAVLGGEPAMSLVPSLLMSGLLTILVSLAFLAVGTLLVQRRWAGAALTSLSTVLLLVGGGFGPPIVGTVVGVAAMRALRPAPAPQPVMLGKLWPVCFVACVASWLMVFPGISLVASFVAVGSPAALLSVVVSAFVALAMAILTAGWRDGLDAVVAQ